MIGKRYLPKSLFGRTLLILVAPTVMIQLVLAYVFFDRHWENVTRHMSNTLAGEMAFLVRQLSATPARSKTRVIGDFEETTHIKVDFESADSFAPQRTSTEFPEFQEQLKAIIKEPFTVQKTEEGTIEIRIRMPGQTLLFTTSIKRLESRTTVIFVGWMFGASVLFLCIAVLFLRNQIRPINRLAAAADSFGRGVDMPGFRPHGATEVRKAAHAFIIMRERIKRQLRTRTDMLSGISHDLRTPLTRMKLQLAMMGDSDAIRELEGDVQQMEHMIAEYLDFVRGEGGEETENTNLRALLFEIVSDYQRMQMDVTLAQGTEIYADIRISAVRRMLHNLMDNALRYGKRCRVALQPAGSACEIIIDDEGPGIPADKHAEVFKPFVRLDPSRNIKTGGVGLGLTIARDVALSHGGGISLATSPEGGLRVVIRLPL